jgi:hypothetical protein
MCANSFQHRDQVSTHTEHFWRTHELGSGKITSWTDVKNSISCVCRFKVGLTSKPWTLSCLHKHIYVVNRHSWLTSDAPSVTFLLPLIINVTGIADWCIDRLARSVLSPVELPSIDRSTVNFLARLIATWGPSSATITCSPISKCTMRSKRIWPSPSFPTTLCKRWFQWACWFCRPSNKHHSCCAMPASLFLTSRTTFVCCCARSVTYVWSQSLARCTTTYFGMMIVELPNVVAMVADVVSIWSPLCGFHGILWWDRVHPAARPSPWKVHHISPAGALAGGARDPGRQWVSMHGGRMCVLLRFQEDYRQSSFGQPFFLAGPW